MERLEKTLRSNASLEVRTYGRRHVDAVTWAHVWLQPGPICGCSLGHVWLQVRMRQLGLRQAILQQRAAKLGAEQGPSRWEEDGESGRKGSQTTGIAIAKGWGALRKVSSKKVSKQVS